MSNTISPDSGGNGVTPVGSNGKKPVPVLSKKDFTASDPRAKAEQERAKDLYTRSILSQEKEYPLPVPVITINQGAGPVPFLTLKSVSLFQGKQKSRKTTVLAMAIAAFISGRKDGYFSAAMDGVCLVFDTEQGESYAARTMQLILKLAGVETSPHLIYSDLRTYSPEDRLAAIRAGIESVPNVRLVIIDGLVDLMIDFMAAGEAHGVVTEMIRLASEYNLHLAWVLHQNKGDNNARAHVGTISSQKCEFEISVEIDTQDRQQSIIKCVNSRSLPFEDFAIRWERGGLPCILTDWTRPNSPQAKSARELDRAREIVEACFKPLQSYAHTEAIKLIMKAATKCETTAKDYLKNYCAWQLVDKGDDGRYRVRVR